MPNLYSIAEIRMGATLRGRDATRPTSQGRLRLIRIGDLSNDGTFLTDCFDRIEPKDSIRPELLLRPGDVLFPNRGTRTTAVACRLQGADAIAGSQFFILRPDANLIWPEYLAWYLRGDAAARHFEGRRRGSYVKIIQRRDLAELPIPVPPLAVQRRMVAIADLATRERELSMRLAELKWKLTQDRLASVAAQSNARPLPRTHKPADAHSSAATDEPYPGD